VVSKNATTTKLIASATSLSFGQPLALTATVIAASGPVPAGTVAFYGSASAYLGAAPLNGSGVATLVSTPKAGSYLIKAVYNGSSADQSSESALLIAVTINPDQTTTILTASPNPANFGSRVTFTAIVRGTASQPIGNISFYDGTALLATSSLQSGTASYSTSSLGVGSHNITAVYAGTSDFDSSTSNDVVEVINAANFILSAAPTIRAVYTGEAASYTVTIKPGNGFNLAVSLSCPQLPVNTTCTFTPAMVAEANGVSALLVQTTSPRQSAANFRPTGKSGLIVFAGLFVLFFPLRLRRARRSWPMLFVICALSMAGIAGFSSCGGSGRLTGGTPVGVHTITISGSVSNGVQTEIHQTTVTLSVQSLF